VCLNLALPFATFAQNFPGMLQISFLRDKKEEALQRLAIKNFNDSALIDKALEFDDQRKKTQTELDSLLSSQNSLAKQVGELFKGGKAAEANDLKNKSAALKESSKQLNIDLERIEKELQEILVKIPNAPSVKVPKGKTPAENEEV
jgi:seryl-tRNA synthetase